MKKTFLILLLISALLLGGCSQQAAPQPTAQPSPTPAPLEAPSVTAQGQLADAARALLAPYDAYLSKVAQHSKINLSYTIPGDLFAKMASDAQEMNVQPQNDRYQFTWRQSGEHAYRATGLEVQEYLTSLPTADPETAQPDSEQMDDQKMGDFSVTGGGMFDRIYSYDVAADLSSGSAEITNTLNGETTGHETFTFCFRDQRLYFVYAAREMAVNLDVLESTGNYLVTAGYLGENAVETVDFLATQAQQIPHAQALEWHSLLSTVTPLARLSGQGDQISATE